MLFTKKESYIIQGMDYLSLIRFTYPLFVLSTILMAALATPIQTGILGRLSADTIAANSVSTTMFQYLKVITIGEASASAVLIGTTIGENRGTTKVKEYSKTLQVIYLIIGSVLGINLFFLRIPLLSLYDLNLISTWAIVMPLSFLGTFVWKLPVPMVVLLLNSDQLFKCIPTYLYVKKDQWIKVLV